MSSDEQSIRELVAQWHRATAAGDVDAVLRLMDEDVVFLVAGKPPIKGRSAFEKGLRKLLKTHRIESSGEIQELRVAGPLAYCWTLLTLQMKPISGRGKNKRSGHTLSIFSRQDDGSWVLVRDANLLPPPS